VLALIGLSAALGGCGSDMFSGETKLSKFQFFARQDSSALIQGGEKNFSTSGPVAAEDLVDANGYCAGAAATVQPASAGDTGASPIPSGTVIGGIALGMTECEVVRRAGPPASIQSGAETGDRSIVLTYPTGNWPGIYRFSAGRLKEVERVAEPPPPPKPFTKKKAKATPKPRAG
jgi:hypothetical protein